MRDAWLIVVSCILLSSQVDDPPLHDQSKISQQIPVQLQQALNSCVTTHAADLLTRPGREYFFL
jgi:hypothetical protein